jgi:deoxyribose-phosphate aldolase
MALSDSELAARIDHTALAPDLLLETVDQRCAEALEHGFAGVCVPPWFVERSVQNMEKAKAGKLPAVVTVIGFPMGYSATAAKVEEARRAFDQGAAEVDVVVNLAALKNGRWSSVRDDLQSVITLAAMSSRLVKVIVESALLSDAELIKVCEMANALEPDFVKTSTGFNGPGASLKAIKTMREVLAPGIRIKASGGIKTRAFAEELVEAGADRIGTSNGVALLEPTTA